MEIVPGSLLSQLSVMAAPDLWSRLVDIALSMGDPEALIVHARVERWPLDEFPLPGRLVHEILDWLYRENRFCAGTLRIGDRILGPSSLRVSFLAVVNTADAVAPPRSVAPLIDAMPTPALSNTPVRPEWACSILRSSSGGMRMRPYGQR